MARTVYTATNGNLYIVVQSGDTLSEIASTYLNTYGKSLGYTTSSAYQTWLKNTNGIKNANYIYAGDTLVLRTGYKITYYAGGGTGAPSTQWKAYNKSIVLSNNKPTLNGYIFKGWNNTGYNKTNVTHAPGSTYTSNAALNLYPVWAAATYTVTYNVNGGTGTIASQTKSYNINLTLSSSVPTRTGYEFVGWGTSAYDTAAKYSAGGTYSTNANVTLYAIWKFIYNKPKISNFLVSRCTFTIDGTITVGGITIPKLVIAPSDKGPFGGITFDWSSDLPTTSVTIRIKSRDASDWYTTTFTDTATEGDVVFNSDGKSGYASTYINGGTDADGNDLPLADDITYVVQVEVTDELGSSKSTKILEGATYVVDFADGGKGVGVGCVAPDITAGNPGVLEVGFQTKLTGGLVPVEVPSDNLDDVMTPGFYASSDTVTYSNKPPVTGTFTLGVYAAGSAGQLLQRFTSCSKDASVTYERFYYYDAWGNWIKTHDPTLQKKLESIGTEYSASTNVQITTANVDTFTTAGPSITLPAGTYVITGFASFLASETNTSAAIGYRPIQIGIRNGSTTIDSQRTLVTTKMYARLNITCIQTFTSETTVSCQKSSSGKDSGATAVSIKAVRIK